MPEAAPPSVQALLASRRRILVTGGAVVRRLLTESHVDRSIEGPGGLRLDKLAGLRHHRQQRERHVPSAAGGAGPLEAATH